MWEAPTLPVHAMLPALSSPASPCAVHMGLLIAEQDGAKQAPRPQGTGSTGSSQPVGAP
jgi:hypothetical protein